MSVTATLLAQVQFLNSRISELTLEEIFWSSKLNKMTNQVAKMQKLQQKYDQAFDKALDNSQEIDINGYVIPKGNMDESIAEFYAEMICPNFDAEVLRELEFEETNMDLEKTAIETVLQTTQAEKDATQSALDNSAKQDIPFSSGGG